jgi:prepilin-type N-terminal cleavage/methylation domain-containing protein
MARIRQRNRHSGFSLIELVVVIAVLALLLAISLPMFLRFIEDAAIRAAQVALIDAHKECQIGIKRNISNPTYKIPQNNGYFEFPDLGADGMCLSPSTGNILTAARTDGGQTVSTYNLNINVVTGAKSTDRAVPAGINWQ